MRGHAAAPPGVDEGDWPLAEERAFGVLAAGPLAEERVFGVLAALRKDGRSGR